jgi:hypothetical protein
MGSLFSKPPENAEKNLTVDISLITWITPDSLRSLLNLQHLPGGRTQDSEESYSVRKTGLQGRGRTRRNPKDRLP